MSDPLRLILWDLDGTLVDSQHNIVQAMTLACEACGVVAPEPAAVRRGIGLSLVEAIAQAMPHETPEVHARVAGAYKEAFVALRTRGDHREDLFPGARQVLHALDEAGWLMGVVTGKSRRGVDAFIERHGFAGRFLTIQTPDDNPGKPHPAMCLRAMRELGADPELTVTVGDTTFDMQMARAAGTHAIGVGWGNHPGDELRRAGAHTVLDSFAGLEQAARELIEGGVKTCVSVRS